MTQAPSRPSAAGESDIPRPAGPLLTRGFVLLCVAALLCVATQSLLSPILPLYIQELGSTPFVAGLIFTAFSIVSFVLRPLMGHLTDSWNVRGTLISGAAILGATSLAFLVPWLPLMFVANGIRGIGWGAYNTAGPTAMAFMAPAARRAEASGYYNVAAFTAIGLAPALSLWLLSSTGEYGLIFVLATVAGFLAMGTYALMPAVGPRGAFRGAFHLPRGGISLETFVERRVLLASLLLVWVALGTPVQIFIPAHALSMGVENIGLYFIMTAVVSIMSRLVVGRFVDRGARGYWIVVGNVISIVGFAVLALSNSLGMFLVAAVINSFGSSLSQPALSALSIDLADRQRMGKSMATFSMFYRVGEGLGAPLAGGLIQLLGYPGMYLGAIACTTVGIVLAFVTWRVVGKPLAPHPSS
jgi:MFS family permease